MSVTILQGVLCVSTNLMVWWLFKEEALPQMVDAPAALYCAGRLFWVSKAVRFLLVALWGLLVCLLTETPLQEPFF